MVPEPKSWLSPWFCCSAPVYPICLSRWCFGLDEDKQITAIHLEDWDSLVHDLTSPALPTNDSCSCRSRPRAAVNKGSQLGHFHRQWRHNAVSRHKDCGCFAVLRQLRSIRRSVPNSVFQTLVAALVMPCLDYGNATLAGLHAFQHHQLQPVLNAAARLIHRSPRYEHITPLLRNLHWLRSPERIDF